MTPWPTPPLLSQGLSRPPSVRVGLILLLGSAYSSSTWVLHAKSFALRETNAPQHLGCGMAHRPLDFCLLSHPRQIPCLTLKATDLNPPTVSGRFGQGASLLGEIEVTPNLPTSGHAQNEVFLSVIVSKPIDDAFMIPPDRTLEPRQLYGSSPSDPRFGPTNGTETRTFTPFAVDPRFSIWPAISHSSPRRVMGTSACIL